MVDLREFKSYVHYNPSTGVFTSLSRRGSQVKSGDILGSEHSEGYLSFYYKGCRKYNHHWAVFYMTGKFPRDQVDHINRNRTDNRWVNLREVTNKENHKNESLSKNSSTGITGVSLCKNGRYRCHIKVDYKQIHLGMADHIFEAACIRKSAEILHGFSDTHGCGYSDYV